MPCEELLTQCNYSLVASLGAVIVALVSLTKAHNTTKSLEELKKE